MIKLSELMVKDKEAFQMEREGRISFKVGHVIGNPTIEIYLDNYNIGYAILLPNVPFEDLNSPPPKHGYLFVDKITLKADYQQQGYGFLLYKEALKVAQKNKFKGLISSKFHRSHKASSVWDKLKTFDDDFYDYLDIKDLGTKIFEAKSSSANITIFRGVSAYNKNGNYWTTDKEFARNFTQSGQDKEILRRHINPNVIYKKEPLPQSTDANELDVVEDEAKQNGFKAFWADEGSGSPPSIYVMDKSALL